ncbi:MAG: hypothetical protein ACYC8T_20505 [Myxococcaceae bacterium]
MQGLITNREVLRNAGVIWREFGLLCLLRCLWVLLGGRQTTFLDVVFKR